MSKKIEFEYEGTNILVKLPCSFKISAENIINILFILFDFKIYSFKI